MNDDKKALLRKLLIDFGVGAILVVLVFSIKGFFIDTRVLADAFSSAGLLMILFSGLLYVSGEGAFLGIGYALGRAIKALIPFSHKEHETYAQYRERKTGKKKTGDWCLVVAGLVYLLVGVIFTIIVMNA